MYQDEKGLYLRHESPTAEDHYKYLRNMRKANVIRYDNRLSAKADSRFRYC